MTRRTREIELKFNASCLPILLDDRTCNEILRPLFFLYKRKKISFVSSWQCRVTIMSPVCRSRQGYTYLVWIDLEPNSHRTELSNSDTCSHFGLTPRVFSFFKPAGREIRPWALKRKPGCSCQLSCICSWSTGLLSSSPLALHATS